MPSKAKRDKERRWKLARNAVWGCVPARLGSEVSATWVPATELVPNHDITRLDDILLPALHFPSSITHVFCFHSYTGAAIAAFCLIRISTVPRVIVRGYCVYVVKKQPSASYLHRPKFWDVHAGAHTDPKPRPLPTGISWIQLDFCKQRAN